VIGNYRWRLSLAPREPEYAGIENRLQKAPSIAVPAITIDGEYDPFTPPGNGAAEDKPGRSRLQIACGRHLAVKPGLGTPHSR
jgi:hypothetical protein